MNFDIHFEHNVWLNMKDECLQIQENAVLTRNQLLIQVLWFYYRYIMFQKLIGNLKDRENQHFLYYYPS